KTREHFIASPVPGEKAVYVSGLGAFNTSRFDCLAIEPGAARRVLWTKSAPLLTLPVVSPPATSAGKLIFGDGMHQTDRAIWHCLDAATGMPVWELGLAGRLVHLEGAPTITDGKVYVGGGNAGVLCIDPLRVSLEGKEQDLAAVRQKLDARWKELLAAYEKEKAVDPDF